MLLTSGQICQLITRIITNSSKLICITKGKWKISFSLSLCSQRNHHLNWHSDCWCISPAKKLELLIRNALRAPRLPHVRTAFSHSKFQGWHGCAHYRNRFTRVQLPGKQCSCIGMGEHIRVGETVVHSTLDSNQHWLNVGLFFFFFLPRELCHGVFTLHTMNINI